MRLFLQHVCALACAMAQAPAFEAASVKPSASPSRGGMRGGPGTADPGRIAYTNVTLRAVLLRAYGVKTYQLAGPDWLGSARYDILAMLPPGASREQFESMLQNLLAERFHLSLHRENREVDGYELVPGKSGPKLKTAREADSGPPAAEPASPPRTDANGFPVLDRPGLAIMEGTKGKAVISYLTARAQSLSALVDVLGNEFRLPIADRTGLTGKFDFTLEFAPQPPGALTAPSTVETLPAAADDSAPNLVTAVQQQLGLKLNPRKVRLEVLVIDRADRVPVEN
jgi:uncharacterized protein (TIGR03435 family)